MGYTIHWRWMLYLLTTVKLIHVHTEVLFVLVPPSFSHTLLFSSQTLNSAVLAKARMRAELASDHTHQLYTYCQDYHSMTFEPVDVQNEKKTQRYKMYVCDYYLHAYMSMTHFRLDSRHKWRSSEGFVYPGVPSTRESNTHHLHPHPGRVQELREVRRNNNTHSASCRGTVTLKILLRGSLKRTLFCF